MPSPNSGAGFRGFQDPDTTATHFGTQAFVIGQMIRRISTATLVQVQAVTTDGGVSPVGFVDILPLVNQVDGAGNATPHGTIYKCPYLRVQGGANAVILDPQVGDIGVAVFADHDVSSVTANRGQANPGSRRRFDMADGLYLGGMLNAAPSQYVQFGAQGVTIHSPTKVTLEAPDVQITAQTMEIAASSSVTITTPTFTVNGISALNGATTITGLATVDGATLLNGPLTQGVGGTGWTATMQGPVNVATDVTAAGKSLATHVHTGVHGGSDNSGPPL